MCDEKAAATAALGVYAEETGAAFQPFIEPTLKCLTGMQSYLHESVRAAAYEAMPRILSATMAAFPAAQEGEAAVMFVRFVLFLGAYGTTLLR